MAKIDEKVWYVLRSLKPVVKISRAIGEEMSRRSAWREAGKSALEYYVPTFVVATKSGGNVAMKEKPLCLNYVFVHSTLSEAMAFCKECPSLSLFKDGRASGNSRVYAFVPDNVMRMFMVMVRAYKDSVPLCNPLSVDLNIGDTVRVVGGDFDGIEGVLQTKQGVDGGTVILRVTSDMLVPTLTIDSRHLQIVSFGDGNGHVYDWLAQYGKKIRLAMRNYLTDEGVSDEERFGVEEFVSRFGYAEVPAGKMRSRYDALLMMAHTILGNAEKASAYICKCSEALKSLPDDTSKVEVLVALFACTGNRKYEADAKAYIARWNDKTLKGRKKEIVGGLLYYERHYGHIKPLGSFVPAEMQMLEKRQTVQSYGIPVGRGGFVSFVGTYIKRLKTTGRVSAAERYASVVKSFVRYLGFDDVSFANFTKDMAEGYRDWLIQKGLAENTVSFYVRNLSSLYNRAKAKGICVGESPFKGVKLASVPKKTDTERNVLSFGDVCRLNNLDLAAYNQNLSIARDLVLFTIYAKGIMPIDLLMLKRSDIIDGLLAYNAHSTGKRVTVEWNPLMQGIADHYSHPTPYLFPCITAMDSAMASRQCHSVLRSVNRNVRELGRILGMDSPLSLAVARHSWQGIMERLLEDDCAASYGA